MGSLSNLYISQSYTSLVHLGNDGPITQLFPNQFVELQDGLGNSLNIELNQQGDVNIGGILSASNIPTDIATQAELNAYTQSTNIRLNNIETTTSSLNTSVSQLNIWSSSAKISIDALNTFTASTATSQSVYGLNQWSASAKIELANLESTTASLNTSVSNLNQFSASQLTKDATLAGVTSSLQAFTQSANIRLNNLESKSASVDISIANINVATSSLQQWSASAKVELASLEIASSSLQQWSASAKIQIANLESKSASVDISVAQLNAWSQSAKLEIADLIAHTGSYATTGSNTFIGNQNIIGDITASNLNVAGTINAYKLNVTIESSSVIFSSGSNILGDAADDTQTLYGHVNAVNTFTASGLRYPTADDGAKSFMMTDGAGNLSLQYVDAINTYIHNGELTTIVKGTPLYVSGANGANPIVYIADASNPNRMPVTYIAADNIASGANGRGIVLGQIDGVNTTGYPSGTEIYVAEGGGWTANRPSGSNSIVQPLGIVTKEGNGGKGLVLNPGPAFLPNIQTGYVWVGNGTNQPVSVATSSFATLVNTGSLVTTSSFNTYTASTNIRLNNLEAATSSYAISSSVAAVDAAQQAQINSLIAWTGSVTSSTTIESNGTILGQVNTLNFIGTGANVSVGAGTASITINAGSGSGGGTAGNSYSSTFMGSTWVVNHNLNTSVPLVFAYESGSQWVIPAQLDVTSPNSVTLVFSSVVSGSVVVVNGGDQTVISNVTNATSAVITHNLNTDWPIVQVYESGSRAQIIPLSVVSDSLNQITVGFSTPTSAKVVIKK